MKIFTLTMITLVVATASAFSRAPNKSTTETIVSETQQAVSFELVSDKQKTCVYAPLALKAEEKRQVLSRAANEFRFNNPESTTKSLCLALLDPAKSEGINTFKAGKRVEVLEPGSVSWSDSKATPVVTLNDGFEREDAAEYVNSLAEVMNGKACVKKKKTAPCTVDYKVALSEVHAKLGVTEHPLDWLLAP